MMRLLFGKSTLGEAHPGGMTSTTLSPRAFKKYRRARATPHPGQKPWGGTIYSLSLYLNAVFVILIFILIMGKAQPDDILDRPVLIHGVLNGLLNEI